MNKRRTAFAAAAIAAAMPVIMLWEGKVNKTYLDIGGVPTACYGQTGPQVTPGIVYDDKTCETWLRAETGEKYDAMMRCLPAEQEMKPYQAAAMLVFAYNVGVSGACRSAAARYARAGDWRNACRAIQVNDNGIAAWSYVNGRYVQGLANRRAAERRLCEGRV